MQQLVQNLSVALKARLEKLDWMSADTKQRALENGPALPPRSAIRINGGIGRA